MVCVPCLLGLRWARYCSDRPESGSAQDPISVFCVDGKAFGTAKVHVRVGPECPVELVIPFPNAVLHVGITSACLLVDPKIFGSTRIGFGPTNNIVSCFSGIDSQSHSGTCSGRPENAKLRLQYLLVLVLCFFGSAPRLAF